MWRSTAGFAAAFLFLDTVANARYPGREPPFWYVVPCLDVLAVLVLYALFGAKGRRVPALVHAAAFVALLAVRLVRLGDGVSFRFFDRPFNLYIQLPLVPELEHLARDSMSGGEIAGVLIITGVVLVAGSFLTVLALRHAERHLSTAEGRRSFEVIACVLVLAAALVSKPRDGAGFLDLLASSGLARVGKEVLFLARVPHVKRERLEKIAAVRAEVLGRPHGLEKLERNDVLLFVIESYGETAIRSPSQRALLSPIYDAFERDLGALGFVIASSVLDSPTFGGQSWFAHATLSSGVRTENQLEYRLLGGSNPPALARFFRDAGYRTVLAQPGTVYRTPLQDYLDFEAQYLRPDFGYRGPRIGWGMVPDQYAVHVVAKKELHGGGGPRFIQYALVSSHAPWREVPPIVQDPSELGDGSIYARLPVSRAATRWSNLEQSSAAFARAIAYDLEVLRAHVVNEVRGDTLVVMLGDHQPPGGATEGSLTRGAVVHVLSRNAAFIDAFKRRGYTPGMRPSGPPPYPGFETFMPSLLADFSLPRAR